MHVILFFIAISSSFAYANVQEVSISIGDQYPLQFKEEVFVSASRRGIVDVFAISSSRYKIIGLKEGFVSLLISKKGTESRVLVTVENKKKVTQKKSSGSKYKVETIVEVFNKSSMSSTGRRQLTRLNYLDLKAGNYNNSRIGRFYSQVIVQEKKEASMELAMDHHQRREDSSLSRVNLHQGFKSFVRIENTSSFKNVLCHIKLRKSARGGADISDRQKNLMKTTVGLRLNKYHPIGQVDLDSIDHGQMKSGWFSKIPIIGPLFKLSEASKHEILTLYFIKITRMKS